MKRESRQDSCLHAHTQTKLLVLISPFLIGSKAKIVRVTHLTTVSDSGRTDPSQVDWKQDFFFLIFFRWLCSIDLLWCFGGWCQMRRCLLLPDYWTLWCSLLRRQDPQVRPMKYRQSLAATNEAAARGGRGGALRFKLGGDQTAKWHT